MSNHDIDRLYMHRAIQLARYGLYTTSPNPAVGAVVVAGGRIIGEGWHRLFGSGHAEVNAFASVRDRSLLPQATVYVTLEPCSHYGKTPPCARMLAEAGVRRVVVGCTDPNPKVSGRGIAILREAGIEVETGVCEQECMALVEKFIFAQTHGRPFVTLKWAQSADGWMDITRAAGEPPYRFSTPLSWLEVMQLRSLNDAIAVGAGTVIADNPSLTVRGFGGNSPARVVFDRRGLVSPEAKVFLPGVTRVYIGPERSDLPEGVDIISESLSIEDLLQRLRSRYGWNSLLVEGGASLLSGFIEAGIKEKVRVECAPVTLGSKGRVKAPKIP